MVYLKIVLHFWQWTVVRNSPDFLNRELIQSWILLFSMMGKTEREKGLINNLWTRLLHWSDWVMKIPLKIHEEHSQRKLFAPLLGRPGLLFPSAISLILAWQSPLCRSVAANTMKSLSTWLFSKVIRHVWPGKSAPPSCQVRRAEDYIFKSCH